MFKKITGKPLNLLFMVLALVGALFLLNISSTLVNAKEEKISLMYLYGDTTDNYIKQLETTKGSVNTISPNYFNLNDDGSLDVSTNPKLNDYAQKSNLKVIPFLSNHWDQITAQKALGNKEKLATDLVAAVMQYNYDGLCIDLENLASTDKDSFTQLITLINEKLPEQKQLIVAVGSLDKPTSSGWKAAYDFSTLGELADYVLIMAYDQHWSGGKPGPVAGLDWMINQIDYTLTLIPKEKTILGIPFYGRVWFDQGKGTGYTYNGVIDALEKNNATSQWHIGSQTPHAAYSKDGVQRDIWYEDVDSLSKKLRLVSTYDLAGVAAWKLGQEDPLIWKNYSTIINRSPAKVFGFTDLSGHQAEKSIMKLWKMGIISSSNDGKYYPDKATTKAEVIAMIDRISNWDSSNTTPIWTDVKKTHWAYTAIANAQHHQILKAYENKKTLDPNGSISLSELSNILVPYLNLTIDPAKEINTVVADLPTTHPNYQKIKTLVNAKIYSVPISNKIEPDRPLTRGEFAMIMDRILVTS